MALRQTERKRIEEMPYGSGLTRGAQMLTHRSIEALRPSEAPYRVPDQRCKGLAVRVAPSGATSAARAPNPSLISLPCVLGLDEAGKPAKAKGFLSPSETNGFARRS